MKILDFCSLQGAKMEFCTLQYMKNKKFEISIFFLKKLFIIMLEKRNKIFLWFFSILSSKKYSIFTRNTVIKNIILQAFFQFHQLFVHSWENLLHRFAWEQNILTRAQKYIAHTWANWIPRFARDPNFCSLREQKVKL